MKKSLIKSFILFFFSSFLMACGNLSQDEQAPGKEVELAGDEADESPVDTSKVTAYDQGDTVVNIKKTAINDRLREHASVLVNTYLEMGEALMQDDIESAKARAEQIREILERNEQENMELQAQVKELYTNAAHIIRQSARNSIAAENERPVRMAYAAMAPAAYKMAKIASFNGKMLYYHYCPEAFENSGAYWLSRTAETNNPYGDGSNLKNCGEVVGSL